MADDLEGWFTQLPYKLRRDLARKLRGRVETAAEKIADNAPEKSGKLKGTVRVRRRRNELDLEILAGGAATTKEIRTGSGTGYDYALATEFGNEHVAAEPWFYATWNAGLKDETAQGIADDVAEILKRA